MDQPEGPERTRGLAEAEAWLAARRLDSPLPVARQMAPHLVRFRQGFAALNGCRTIAIGFGASLTGEIWYPALSAWLRDNGYEPRSQEWARAESLIQALDRAYVAHANRPPEKEPEPAPGAGQDE